MLVVALLACDPAQPQVEEKPGRDSGEPDTGDSAEPESCGEPAALPVSASYLSGFQGSEDFAFDAEGYLVALDAQGTLLGIDQLGQQKVILPNATNFGAGMRFLPGGDLVFADAEKGNLARVNPSTGELTVVLSGLEYPNGLDVDYDGFVYVSEQNAGRVRRIDPDSGDYTTVAKNLYNPNGVTFSVGHDTLYVGSFGAGVAWAVDRDGDDWAEPRVYATTPEAPGVPPDWCATYGEGSECPVYYGYGIGTCAVDDEGDLECAMVYDTGACDGLAAGDGCVTERFDAQVSSSCTEGADGLFCPHTNAEWIGACVGERQGESCEVHGVVGTCYTSYEGVLACYDWQSYYDGMESGCIDQAAGSTCEIDHELFPSVGVCGDGTAYGLGDNVCLPGGYTYSERGGLDGINVDACDNLYVTEYIQGMVWRFDAEGAEAQLAAKLRSSWIPNLHWGNGVGGWDPELLYVMDRDRGGVFALPVGVEGHGDAYTP
ncbi:MAG: SMP-30/gluconolactonase/LRE family protein [Deltaproteobacteria bacterium]|nr:SMP-30/gluconolactonase/LRE family protein [Deltaproteobacteria bacterium]